MYICTPGHTHSYIYKIYIHIYYMHVCMYVCTHIHIHTYIYMCMIRIDKHSKLDLMMGFAARAAPHKSQISSNKSSVSSIDQRRSPKSFTVLNHCLLLLLVMYDCIYSSLLTRTPN